MPRSDAQKSRRAQAQRAQARVGAQRGGIEGRDSRQAPGDAAFIQMLIGAVPEAGEGTTHAKVRLDVDIEIPGAACCIDQFITAAHFILIVLAK